jgi:DNA helicase-2/ATP-dependent DNA helicase PcrA
MTLLNNKLIVAAAGSGKTTFLVEEALKTKEDQNILITTFTEANEAGIKNKIIEKNKFIPANVIVQTWFSVLLQHGVRPYQGYFFNHDIKGMHLVSGQSGSYTKETDVEKHYFDKKHRIYSDKISKFLIKCQETSGGKVLDRLSQIYPNIFVDEVQDLAGYDLDFLKLLFSSNINILLVGDPRQGTYSTNNATKNKKYKKSAILNFFEDDSINIDKDDQSLTINHRSTPAICDFSNRLFPQHQKTTSGNTKTTSHDGMFLVRTKDVDHYLSYYQPIQLRDSRKTLIENGYLVMNFGESKGLSFDRALIYPTAPIVKWFKDNNCDLAPISRSKLYVAITRARYSVAFVYDYKDDEVIDGITKYISKGVYN